MSDPATAGQEPVKPVEPPATPDLTKNDNAKEIRKLQDKVITLETSLQKARADLDAVAPVIKKLGEMPPIQPGLAPAEKTGWKTALEQIEAMIFPPKAK